MASIYQRNGRWWICFYENGRKIQRSLKTKSKIQAKYLKNEIENRLSSGETLFLNKKIDVNEAFAEFRQYRQSRISRKAQAADHYRIKKFIADAGIRFLSDISQQNLRAHLDERIADISKQTANHTIRAVKTFLNFCVKNKYLKENPISGFGMYAIDKKAPRFLDEGEIQQLLTAARGSSIEIVILTAIFTGMRLGEILRMDWQDIDLDGGVIHIPISKSKRFRNVPMHPVLRESLLEHKNAGQDMKFNENFVGFQFKQIRKKSGILRHFRFHDLRHTFASLLVKRGVDIYRVSKLLGHTSIKTTEIYAHLRDEDLKTAVNVVQIPYIKK